MKAFLAVSAFFAVFAGCVGGGMKVMFMLVRSHDLSENAEAAAMAVGTLLVLVLTGLLMKALHSLIQRRI